jgi:hypothetical protein
MGYMMFSCTLKQVEEHHHYHRIYTTPELRAEMKRTFLATYARHLEAKLRQSSGGDYDELSIEPFHEFVDIEFDIVNNLMIWTPSFRGGIPT